MADFGIFIGFGIPVPGREVAAAQVFGEAIAYYEELKAAGDIESYTTGVLEAHGGDLGGFIILRGEPEKLGRVRGSEKFQRNSLRAAYAVQDVGVVTVLLDGEAGRFVSTANDITADLR
ncbi:MAG TPA: hypothetical protein VIM30_12425 [Candidatus Limnocylindrales bacterium]|jgi:hypothetical protein